MNTILIVLPVLTILMFDLGLSLKPGDFIMVIKRPAVVLTALFGQIILLPALAFALATVFRLPAELFIGLVLIACCPGGSSSNLFSKLAGGDVALSVMLTALSSLITLVTVPVIMGFVTEYAGNAQGIVLPAGNLLKQNLLLMLLPVLLGIVVHYVRPQFAAAADRILSKVIFPALLAMAGLFFIQNHRIIADNIGVAGTGVTLLIILSASAAAVICRLFRFDARSRRTIVIEVGMQNAAQAIAVAGSPFIFNNPKIAIPGILYSLIMNIVLLAYVGLAKRSDRG